MKPTGFFVCSALCAVYIHLRLASVESCGGHPWESMIQYNFVDCYRLNSRLPSDSLSRSSSPVREKLSIPWCFLSQKNYLSIFTILLWGNLYSNLKYSVRKGNYIFLRIKGYSFYLMEYMISYEIINDLYSVKQTWFCSTRVLNYVYSIVRKLFLTTNVYNILLACHY